MKSVPQLRIRTEYSLTTAYRGKSVYGHLFDVGERLEEIETPFAACVDTSGTWGHVQFQKEMLTRGIEPGFGAEFEIIHEGINAAGVWEQRKPTCFVLAGDVKQFYRFSSSNPNTPEEFAAAKGIVRFSGLALTDPECFDYIDLNPANMFHVEHLVKLAKRTRKPLVMTGLNGYPGPDERQAAALWVGGTPRYKASILSGGQLFNLVLNPFSNHRIKKIIKDTTEIGERLSGLRLPVAPMVDFPGDLSKLVDAGKVNRLVLGHIAQWSPEYEKRLTRELNLIREKEYQSYFMIVADLVTWAKQRMLVGPARGSAAGSLVCYLLGITEVDPLQHDLIFERFIDVGRSDLPDIDIDFSHINRHLVFEYLTEKYGVENVGRIGSVNTLQPRSALAHGCDKLGIPKGATFTMLNVLYEYLKGHPRYGHALEDTFNSTQPGREFIERYPEARIISKLENHASHHGVHAAGVIVSNEPVIEYCTVKDGVAQVDKNTAEDLNLLKIDALGLRALGVIEDAGCVTQTELYSLKLDDQKVFDLLNDGKFAGVFQFEGAAQRNVSQQIHIDSFLKMDHITALSRPGPLGSGADKKYILSNKGLRPVLYHHPLLEKYLGQTFGVVLYQEQVMQIIREIGGFSWEKTTEVRRGIGKSKGSEYLSQYEKSFLAGAKKKGIDKKTGENIWSELVTFGRYGMNKSHTASYSIISYWCAWLKVYHPTEFAAACLRHAKDDQQRLELLRELVSEGIEYIAFDPLLSEADWCAKEGKVIGGFQNVVGIGPVKSVQYMEKRAAGKLTESDIEKLNNMPVENKELFPARLIYKDFYENPGANGVNGRIIDIAQFEDQQQSVFIARLIDMKIHDENEPARVARRGGEIRSGQTQFLDLFVVDDSVSQPIRARVGSWEFDEYGVPISQSAKRKTDWFLIRAKFLEKFNMFSIIKIKCLTNPEVNSPWQ